MIANLESNEVFVFGSNDAGFHGAGTAGIAFRGDGRNNWRQDRAFLEANASPNGSYARIGRWACLGVGRGPQRGHEGRSYAIATCKRPGARRSIPLHEIREQIEAMLHVALDDAQSTYLVAPLGAGFAGYTHREMDAVWRCAIAKMPGRKLPSNVKLLFGLGPM